MRSLTLILFSALLFSSCSENKKEEVKLDEQVKLDKVMTQEEQKSLTPEKVMTLLKEGNDRFMKGELTVKDVPKQIIEASKGQYPKAVILSCLDSRVPIEKVFDRSIGDVFVARVAGNIVNTDILASMEYGCKVSGAKLIVVLGHSDCGAVKSAIDNVQLGNITELLAKIRPSIDSLGPYSGEKTSKNKEFVEKVSNENVRTAIDNIRLNSPILKEMEDKGEIKIVGADYDIDNGKVKFY
ncbi:MAG: carbonic anhydrase [Ignavibacteria bacterium]|nr:carbonic anhydrase [Ignavibacteria bacterium]